MSEEITVESRVGPPPLSCPKCDHLLPSKLGVVVCLICEAKVNVEHEGTLRAWKEEKVSCPECSRVLIAGVSKRPAHLKCGQCDTYFTLTEHVPRVEIQCPHCERGLRMKQRPGSRALNCPACNMEFNVNF
jgi:DNA-directed RNA polymerase subunit RPC12/RpoP